MITSFNHREINFHEKWWQWPKSSLWGIASDYQISESFRKDVDAILSQVASFYRPERSLFKRSMNLSE